MPETSAKPFLVSLGHAIATHRNAVGLKQQDVARRCGLSRASISNIEAGRQDVPITRLNLIAQAVGLTPSRLLDAVTFESETDLVEQLQVQNSHLQRRMAAALKALTDGAGETPEAHGETTEEARE
jgi:transcriptional regulator with XRE-family HTH domain